MNFSLKLMLSEAKRNKSKIVIAIVVSLILFMSAFTLCNIASALPSNFYTYYEEYFPETIGVQVHNADKQLYDERSDYFIDVTSDWKEVWSGVQLENEARDKVIMPSIIDDSGETIIVTTLDTLVIDVQSDEIFSDEMLATVEAGNGVPWTTEQQDGIWISDYVAGAQVGDSIMYTIGDNSIPIIINGIITDELYSNANDGSQVFAFIHEEQAKDIIFSFDMSFYMYGNVAKVADIFAVYTSLDGDYSLSDSIAMDMVSKVKTAEAICGIIGGLMLVGGLVILLNFISMFISSNIQHIGVMRMLGAKTKYITLAYYFIFMLIVTIVSIISWAALPLYNFLVSMYCASIGYPFVIGINYGLVSGLFVIVYGLVTAMMLIKGHSMNRLSPNEIVKEDD